MAVVRHKEAIHSGHFMISNFEAEEQDDEENIAVPVSDFLEFIFSIYLREPQAGNFLENDFWTPPHLPTPINVVHFVCN